MSPKDSAPPRTTTSTPSDNSDRRRDDPERHEDDLIPGWEPEKNNSNAKKDSKPPPSFDPSHPLLQPAYPLLSTYSLLIFATIWGVLARLGLEWIGTFAEGQVFSVIWAQIVGCIVMGLVTDRKEGIEAIFPPLFIMLGTGFCGSLTTWSTMANDTFVAFANLDQPMGTSRFTGFLSGVAITLITLSASICALQSGVHLSDFLPSAASSSVLRHRRPLSRSTGHLLNYLTLFIGPVFWLGSLFLLILGPSSYRPRATFAIVFGPVGTLLRFNLSKYLNPINPRFPIGTFSANVLAVLIFAILGIFARHPNSALSCAAIKGLEDGLCGSLSTVSSFVVELRTLGRKDSWRYFWASWTASEAMLVVVLGAWVWSGDRDGVCRA
ncbi:hypothetical protein JCM3765_005272 [Sporobolomyces pararoseus]